MMFKPEKPPVMAISHIVYLDGPYRPRLVFYGMDKYDRQWYTTLDCSLPEMSLGEQVFPNELDNE